jgi:hypothetical protein
MLAIEDSALPGSRDAVIASHILFFKLRGQRRAMTARFSDGLLRAVAELVCGGQTSQGVKDAQAWLDGRLDWSVRDVFDVLLQSVAPRIGVDKSPHTGMSPLAMERVHRLYPHARFLHLTRHPLPTLNSMHRFLQGDFRRAYAAGDPRDLAGHCARLWYLTHRGILDFTSALPPEKTMRIRGEDLLANPDAHLEDIARWLGVRSDQEAIESMKHPECSPYAQTGPEGARHGNDPKFIAGPQVRPMAAPHSTEPPEELVPDPDLRRNIADLAERLGYAESGARGQQVEHAVG